MMTYTITYRNKDGRQEQMQIEAPDRSAVFAELSKRGISAIRVEEATGKVKPLKPASANGKKAPAVIKGLVAGAIVVVAAGAAWYFLSPKAETPVRENKGKKPGKIAETTPPPVSPAKAGEPAIKHTKPIRKWEFPVSRTNELSDAELRKWKVMHRPPPGYTNDTARTEPPPTYAIFNHHSENEIACLLTLRPGETLVGTPTYGKRFKEDFLKSCEEPIVITEEDTPEQAELKRVMNETKIDLRARMAKGEDLGQILLDTRAEYQRLAAYRQSLESEINELKKNDSLSMEDIDDFISAANKMLEAKGIAPLKLSPITRRMLMRRRGL